MRNMWPRFFDTERQLRKLGASRQLAETLACHPLPRKQAARLLALLAKENTMALARHPLFEHFVTCSGPDNCLEYRALLSMSPSQAAEYGRAQTEHQMKKLGMRTAASGPTAEDRENFARQVQGFGTVVTEPPPDPYAAHLPRPACPRDDPNYDPRGQAPDGYMLAIERAKKGNP